MNRQQTLQMPFLALQPDDLGQMAGRIAGLSGQSDDPWRKPAFSVATNLASFSDADWSALWSRVSSHDVRSITMEGGNRSTHLRVNLDLVSRSSRLHSNTVELSSEDQTAFDAEYGFFMDLFRLRAANVRRLITSGAAGALIWYAVPGVAIGFATAAAYYNLTDPSRTIVARVFLGAVLSLLAVSLIGIGMGTLLERIAPRVTVAGVGPYESVRQYLVQIALGLIVTAIATIVLALGPVVFGSGRAPATPSPSASPTTTAILTATPAYNCERSRT